MAINNDPSLSDAEKAQARQDLMTGKWKDKVSASAASEDAKTDAAKGAPSRGCLMRS